MGKKLLPIDFVIFNLFIMFKKFSILYKNEKVNWSCEILLVSLDVLANMVL